MTETAAAGEPEQTIPELALAVMHEAADQLARYYAAERRTLTGRVAALAAELDQRRAEVHVVREQYEARIARLEHELARARRALERHHDPTREDPEP